MRTMLMDSCAATTNWKEREENRIAGAGRLTRPCCHGNVEIATAVEACIGRSTGREPRRFAQAAVGLIFRNLEPAYTTAETGKPLPTCSGHPMQREFLS